MRLFIAGLGLLILTGCIRTIENQSNISRSADERKVLSRECTELRALGSVRKLIGSIDRDAKHLEKLLDRSDIVQNYDKIIALCDKITNQAQQLIALINSRYLTERRMQEITWLVEPIETQPAPFDRDFRYEIVKAELTDFYTWAGASPVLVSSMSVENNGDNVVVKLSRPADLVELCELQQFINVVLNVSLQAPDGEKKMVQYRLKASLEDQP